MTGNTDSRVPLEGLVMPRALTAENGAKALMMGEFSESVVMRCDECDGDGWLDEDAGEECPVCDGVGDYALKVPISWDTIKAIYAMAVEHLGHNAPHERAAEGGPLDAVVIHRKPEEEP